MSQYTDDPVADFLAYDREQQEWLDRLPVCSHCKEPIQDNRYYVIGEDNVCLECLEDYCDDNFTVYNDEY